MGCEDGARLQRLIVRVRRRAEDLPEDRRLHEARILVPRDEADHLVLQRLEEVWLRLGDLAGDLLDVGVHVVVRLDEVRRLLRKEVLEDEARPDLPLLERQNLVPEGRCITIQRNRRGRLLIPRKRGLLEVALRVDPEQQVVDRLRSLQVLKERISEHRVLQTPADHATPSHEPQVLLGEHTRMLRKGALRADDELLGVGEGRCHDALVNLVHPELHLRRAARPQKDAPLSGLQGERRRLRRCDLAAHVRKELQEGQVALVPFLLTVPQLVVAQHEVSLFPLVSPQKVSQKDPGVQSIRLHLVDQVGLHRGVLLLRRADLAKMERVRRVQLLVKRAVVAGGRSRHEIGQRQQLPRLSQHA
mmetsp:Transcript_12506/g.46267  ORF Transcript_12506/g.46267 Transcript_12506/m.46267 type:complete len:360 (-) Transcript_12506:652-1731(-)